MLLPIRTARRLRARASPPQRRRRVLRSLLFSVPLSHDGVLCVTDTRMAPAVASKCTTLSSMVTPCDALWLRARSISLAIMFVLYSIVCGATRTVGSGVIYTADITEYGIVSLSGLALFQVPWCIQ